ncbi:hypothetical protein DFJ73DRAFT_824644 [Zopfochytrium polystomum]|nr:hypothetical protein DFJ73DRAFT_824644 [Zopfochytrium polystomum]
MPAAAALVSRTILPLVICLVAFAPPPPSKISFVLSCSLSFSFCLFHFSGTVVWVCFLRLGGMLSDIRLVKI